MLLNDETCRAVTVPILVEPWVLYFVENVPEPRRDTNKTNREAKSCPHISPLLGVVVGEDRGKPSPRGLLGGSYALEWEFIIFIHLVYCRADWLDNWMVFEDTSLFIIPKITDLAGNTHRSVLKH